MKYIIVIQCSTPDDLDEGDRKFEIADSLLTACEANGLVDSVVNYIQSED
jgi:hypothetical protein